MLGNELGRYLILVNSHCMDFPDNASGKEPACQCKRRKRRGFDPLEESMATDSSILAWGIPWTEEPGRQITTGSQRVRHD